MFTSLKNHVDFLNKRKFFGHSFLIALLVCLALTSVVVGEVEAKDDMLCTAYLTGIGCSNCAITDPMLFLELTAYHPNLVIIEYEIFKHREENKETKDLYFKSYIPGKHTGVPFFIFDKSLSALGRIEVLKVGEIIKATKNNACPTPDGTLVDFDKLKIADLPGKPSFWTKNRVLVAGSGGDSSVLRKVIREKNISKALEGVEFKKVDPIAMDISNGEIKFQNAVMIGDWRLQWNGDPVKITPRKGGVSNSRLAWIFIVVIFLGVFASLVRSSKTPKVGKGEASNVDIKERKKDILIVGLSLLALVAFLIMTQNVSSNFLEESGYKLPLPLFTFLIALIDGFNPCNMFVLTCLLALLISTSDSRLRLYIVALSFVTMVFIFYFLFMAAWLNVFKYLSFITPLRIGIAIMALVAGLINCKELLFFRKGISLTISDKNKGPLMKKMDAMKNVIRNGSFALLISSSIGLATLASLIELPCTAGFPIIYTGILSGRGMENTFSYYAYLVLYNLVYVLPLLGIVTVFIYTFRARRITQRQMEIIKFIGGIIMLLLGIVLLANPGLLGLTVG